MPGAALCSIYKYVTLVCKPHVIYPVWQTSDSCTRIEHAEYSIFEHVWLIFSSSQVTQEFTVEAEKKAAVEKNRPKQEESVVSEDGNVNGRLKLGGRRRSPLD